MGVIGVGFRGYMWDVRRIPPPPREIREEIVVSALSIWNIALAEMGVAAAQSESDASIQVKRIRSVWDLFRKQFLADHSWNGAIVPTTLMKIDFEPPADWTAAFQLPDKCLRIVKVNGTLNEPGQSDWTVMLDPDKERRLLFTRVDNQAEIQYVTDLTNMGLLMPPVAYAMGMQLAAHIAPKFGKSASEVAALQQRADEATRKAKGTDGVESSPHKFTDDSLLEARW